MKASKCSALAHCAGLEINYGVPLCRLSCPLRVTIQCGYRNHRLYSFMIHNMHTITYFSMIYILIWLAQEVILEEVTQWLYNILQQDSSLQNEKKYIWICARKLFIYNCQNIDEIAKRLRFGSCQHQHVNRFKSNEKPSHLRHNSWHRVKRIKVYLC